MESKDITLYYFPTSYYSLKVLLALYEKGIPFKERIVNTRAGEQNEEWFLKMNHNGEVPTIEFGEEYISESEVIIDVIDHTFTSGPTLEPDLETSLGQEVRDFRMMLDNVNVPLITLGVLANRKFCVENITSPILTNYDRKRAEQFYDSSYNKLLKKRKSCSPELRPAIDRKLEKWREQLASFCNESKVAECLDDLEQVFDKLDSRLAQSKQEAGESKEHWLFGGNFTAADITATMLMYRLKLIGMAPRYFSATTRPAVLEYYTSLMNRPAAQKMVAVSNSVSSYLYRQTLKSFGKKALKIGVVIGLVALGYAGYKEYSNIQKGLAKA